MELYGTGKRGMQTLQRFQALSPHLGTPTFGRRLRQGCQSLKCETVKLLNDVVPQVKSLPIVSGNSRQSKGLLTAQRLYDNVILLPLALTQYAAGLCTDCLVLLWPRLLSYR